MPTDCPVTFGVFPNGLGSLYEDQNANNGAGLIYAADGCFYIQTRSTSQGIAAYKNTDLINTQNYVKFNLSRTSSIFGKSTKVQPKGFQLLMIIKN